MGHAQRTCLIGMRLGDAIGLPEDQLVSLYHALLMKDAGCSSNAVTYYRLTYYRLTYYQLTYLCWRLP